MLFDSFQAMRGSPEVIDELPAALYSLGVPQRINQDLRRKAHDAVLDHSSESTSIEVERRMVAALGLRERDRAPHHSNDHGSAIARLRVEGLSRNSLKAIHGSFFPKVPWGGQFRRRIAQVGNLGSPYCFISSHIAIPQRLDDLVARSSQATAFLQRVAMLYTGMLLIHPFEDGNGRMARISVLGIAASCEERVQACAWLLVALRASQAKFIDAAFALRFGQADALDRLVDEALFVSDSLAGESRDVDFDSALAR